MDWVGARNKHPLPSIHTLFLSPTHVWRVLSGLDDIGLLQCGKKRLGARSLSLFFFGSVHFHGYEISIWFGTRTNTIMQMYRIPVFTLNFFFLTTPYILSIPFHSFSHVFHICTTCSWHSDLLSSVVPQPIWIMWWFSWYSSTRPGSTFRKLNGIHTLSLVS